MCARGVSSIMCMCVQCAYISIYDIIMCINTLETSLYNGANRDYSNYYTTTILCFDRLEFHA